MAQMIIEPNGPSVRGIVPNVLGGQKAFEFAKARGRSLWVCEIRTSALPSTLSKDVRALVRFLDSNGNKAIYDPIKDASELEAKYLGTIPIISKQFFSLPFLGDLNAVDIIKAHITSMGSYLASRYDSEKKASYGHTGIDICAKKGTPVWAPSDGKIALVDTDVRAGVYINLEADYFYRFLHLDSALAKTGDLVSAGDIIGTVGDSGNAKSGELAGTMGITGLLTDFARSHLHYEARKDGRHGDASPVELLLEGKMGLPIDVTYLY